MNISKDAKSLLGLLFHGTIHCICNVSDKGTAGITKELGITPLLKSFGQSIADNLGGDHLKEIFNFNRIEILLKNKHPNDLNHDLEKLFKQSALTSIKYIKLLFQAELKTEVASAKGIQQKTLKEQLRTVVSYMEEQQDFLKRNIDTLKVTYPDIPNSKVYFEQIISHILFYKDSLPVETAQKLVTFYADNLPYCFRLAFYEALKDDKNEKGFKAFQIQYLEDSKSILVSNNRLLKTINEKLHTLHIGNNLIQDNTLDRLSMDILSETRVFFEARFVNLEILIVNHQQDLRVRIEKGFDKLDIISQNNTELVKTNTELIQQLKQKEKIAGLRHKKINETRSKGLRLKQLALILVVPGVSVLIYFGWNTLHVFKKNSLYGYKNFFGITVITPQYDNAEGFKNGIAIVAKGNKFNIVKENGELLFDTFYEQLKIFPDNMVLVRKGSINKLINSVGLSQLINDEPNRLAYVKKQWPGSIPDAIADSKSVAPDTARFGYLDLDGNVIIDIKYDYLDEFREGYAVAGLNGKFGYINRLGDSVIAFKFDEAGPFNSNGIARVMDDGRDIYIDKKGNNLSRDPAFMKANNKELNIDLTLSLKKIPNKKILLSYLPVSQDQWREIIGYKHSSYKEEDERWNLSIQNSEFVNSITFNDIHFFISRINTISGKQYRLPTLEEMEEICKMSIENPEVNIAGLHDSYYLVTSTKDQNDLPVLTILKDNIMLPRYISRIEEVNGPDIVFRICRKAD